MSDGFVKLHRKSVDSRVFSDANLWRLWCWCLLRSSWKRSWYMGLELHPGQFSTGREAASSELGISGSAWYRGMVKLQELGCIRMIPNNRFTIVCIEKWEVYQGEVNNKRTTDEQQMNNGWTTDEQRMNTIEEGKESKESKESSSSSENRDFEFSCSDEPGSFVLRDGDFQIWEHTYQTIDVRSEIRKARANLLTTGDIRTMAATRKYLNSWLQNASNKQDSVSAPKKLKPKTIPAEGAAF